MGNSTQGNGDELHQRAGRAFETLTTNQGIPVADNQNQLKVGERGPVLLEDFVLREKTFHFDHERIMEKAGVIDLARKGFINAAAKRFFEREPSVRMFELGFNAARGGYQWHRLPPGLRPRLVSVIRCCARLFRSALSLLMLRRGNGSAIWTIPSTRTRTQERRTRAFNTREVLRFQTSHMGAGGWCYVDASCRIGVDSFSANAAEFQLSIQ